MNVSAIKVQEGDTMKKQDRERYIQNIYAALHTLSGKCGYMNEQMAAFDQIVKSCSKKKVRGQDRYEWYLQLNPNKVKKDGTMIMSFSEFVEVLYHTLEHMESIGFRITRADLSFNSNDSEDYEKFKKLNRLLICCIADAFSVKNCYKTADLWTDKSLSVAIKNDVLEAENYDKEAESGGTVETKNRLEIRSKRIHGTLEEEFMEKWFKRFDKALERFEEVQARYNQELEQIWLNDIKKEKKDRDFLSLTAFLMQYRDCIFTRHQLIDLLERIGVENPKSKAKNFKERHRIEFFSKTDLAVIIKALKTATIKYFKQ